MSKAKVFKSGNSQAVRLPREFRFATSEVDIFRRGDEVVLRETKPDMTRFLELLYAMSEEAFQGIRDDRPPEERDGP